MMHRGVRRTARIPRRRWALSLLALVFILPGCAVPNPALVPAGTQAPDRYLFERGTELLADGEWAPARVVFRRLVDGYPQSEYRFDAKLGLGDTYLRQGGATALVQAVNEYDEFLRFYPTNEQAGLRAAPDRHGVLQPDAQRRPRPDANQGGRRCVSRRSSRCILTANWRENRPGAVSRGARQVERIRNPRR